MGLLGTLVFGGCSVKEDRNACPLWLYSDMGMLEPYSRTARTLIRHDAGMLGEKVVFRNERTVFDWILVKGDITVSSYCGIEDRYMQGCSLIVPYGDKAPAFRGSSSSVSCYDESLYVVAEDNRQSARLEIQVEVSDGRPYPYELQIEGNVCGMDLMTFSPVFGEFGHAVDLSADNCAVLHVLRQPDSGSLTLSVSDGGRQMASLPLGEWIRETGYDWGDDDLKDIAVRIDYGSLTTTVKISEWEHEEGEEYEFLF